MDATARWEPDFGVYKRMTDDMPVLVVTDIHAHPLASHPVRILVRLALRHPREDGLRDPSELEAFGAAEDAIVEAVTGKLEALYLGRFMRAGHATFVFQTPAVKADPASRLDDVLPDVSPYSPEWGVEDDAEWMCWRDTLAPDDYELQGILNERLLELFRENGDAMGALREVDHLAFFPSRERAEAAARDLRRSGFATDDPSEPEGDTPWSLSFHRRDALADGRADEFTSEVLDVVLANGGTYDGWGAPHADPT